MNPKVLVIAAVLLLLVVLGVAIIDTAIGPGWRTVAAKRATEPRVYRDPETGCEYLYLHGDEFAAMWPRMDHTQKQVCGFKQL